MVMARHSFGWKTRRISPEQLLAVVSLLLWPSGCTGARRTGLAPMWGAPAPAPPEPLSTTIPGAPSPWCVDAGRAADAQCWRPRCGEVVAEPPRRVAQHPRRA